MRSCALVIGLMVLCGCASKSTVPKLPPKPKELRSMSLVFVGNRYAELAPCDCPLKALGGIDREWNITRKWKSSSRGNLFNLTGGTTFVPYPKLYDPQKRDHYLANADFILEALNYLGVIALSPSAEDLSLGTETLKKLEARSVFSFVSSNLYSKSTNKPIFARYLTLKQDKLDVVILGLSAPADPRYQKNEDVRVLSPFDALESVFAELPSKSSFVILISSLSSLERQQVLREFPQINVVLGAAGTEPATFNAKQEDRNSLYINPIDRARGIALLEFELKDPVLAFYNPWTAATTRDTQRIWRKRIRDIKEELASEKLSDEDREQLMKKKEELIDFLVRTSTIPLSPTPDAISYQSETLEIDDTYAEPRNELSALIERFQAAQNPGGTKEITRQQNSEPSGVILK